MSSNIKIKRVCEHCHTVFMARTTRTRFCSHKCNSRAYKAQERNQKLQQSQAETDNVLTSPALQSAPPGLPKILITVTELSALTNLSHRTIYRVMKDEKFPKMKVGKRLLFNKEAVINYMNFKYGCV
ncbi:MAG TPA: helix-turn-helix domain-containing protein [Chitinophagaceae bacterium]|nr:helix-turn-helix domain-containing protein [Chitinophagaceae bacterium]